MRASAPGQSAVLMADVAESLARRGVRYAVIGAMEAAVHGVVRASLEADAVVHGNRVDLLLGPRGMDPELLDHTRQVRLGDATLTIVGGEDFIAMKAFDGGPVDVADARAVIDMDRESLDMVPLRRLAKGFGHDTSRVVEGLVGVVGG